jgi:hypothetical protein
LAVNLAFFLSHAGFTRYYAVPFSMLTMWTVLFAVLAAYPAFRKRADQEIVPA